MRCPMFFSIGPRVVPLRRMGRPTFCGRVDIRNGRGDSDLLQILLVLIAAFAADQGNAQTHNVDPW